MKMRSLLFVPADSEKKLLKGSTSEADVLIIDLEDSVAQSRKKIGREMAADFLSKKETNTSWQAYVRINPLSEEDALHDLAAVVGFGLDGVVLPKANSYEDIVQLSACLDVLEARSGQTIGSTRILIVATETPQAILNMNTYVQPHPRLSGMTWGAEDLSTALGAVTNRELNGELSHTYLMARSMCLIASSATDVSSIDTLYADYKDMAGLKEDCIASYQRGFTGRIAIHPDQVAIINQCFTPSKEAISEAQEIINAFEENPNAGTVGINGRMYDRPHLVQAQRTLKAVSS